MCTFYLFARSMVCVSKFFLHWFRNLLSRESAGDSNKFELHRNLQCSVERSSYLKERSGIILYSHRNCRLREREIPSYIPSAVVKPTRSFLQASQRSFELCISELRQCAIVANISQKHINKKDFHKEIVNKTVIKKQQQQKTFED